MKKSLREERIIKLTAKLHGLRFKEVPVKIGEHTFTGFEHAEGSSGMTIEELSELFYLRKEVLR